MPEALYNLGRCAMEGLGMAKDVKRGLFWLEEGAKRHDVRCMTYLAEIYEKGEVVKRDTKKAEKWRRKVKKENKAPL